MPADSPSVHRSTGFLLTYALAYGGGVIGYLPLLTLLLPLKIEAISGNDRLGLFTATVIFGAGAASLSNIVFGALSDGSVARGGGRRRWLAGGVVATMLSFAVIAAAASPLTIIVAIIVFQVAVNVLLSPLLTIMADEIPDGQKGVASGLLALANPLAATVAASVMMIDNIGDSRRFAIVAAATAACIAPLLLTMPRIAGPAIERAPAPGPLRRDLLVAWFARLLVQIAGNVLALYLLYYFESLSPASTPTAIARRVSNLLIVGFVVPLPFAVLAGRLSDRSGYRRPFVLGASVIAALGLLGMALARDWTTGAAAFACYATGSAVFLSLHTAFAMQLLPNPRRRGRDLGLLNLTNTLPAMLGPLLIWLLAKPRDFSMAMLVLAALTLAGGLIILAVREHR